MHRRSPSHVVAAILFGALLILAGPARAVASDAPAELVWSTPPATETGALFHPGTMSFDPQGRIWVTEAQTGQFAIYDRTGKFIETWGGQGSDPGQFVFNGPDGEWGAIAFAPDGTFYVADLGNARVQKFGPDRAFISQWGTKGRGEGQFIAPIGIAIAKDGSILVSDARRNDILRFDPNGTFLARFGKGGGGDGEFRHPGLIFVDAAGDLFITDVAGFRVQKFDPSGTFLMAFGARGTGHGTFRFPDQAVTDSAGRIFVADQGNSVVQVFDPTGKFLAQWGDRTMFMCACGVLVDEHDMVYVLDAGNNRVAQFRLLPPLATS